ncbi:MAG: hypothetical protein P8Y76_02885 [bacterium]
MSAAGADAVELRSAVFPPSGRVLARTLEKALPARLPLGAFLALAAVVPAPGPDR